MKDARWLSDEEALPEPGELAFVYVFDHGDGRVIFRTLQVLTDHILSELEEMEEGDEAKITVETMTAERLGNLPEFEGW